MYASTRFIHISIAAIVALDASREAAAQAPSAPADPVLPPETASPPPPAPEPLAPTEPQVPPAPEAGAPGAPDTTAIATATPEVVARPTPAQPQPAPAQAWPDWLEYFSLGGGLIVYYYQPTEGDGKNNVSVFFANLLLDGEWDAFALHVEPRFRDTKLRSYFDGTAWLQEAYASGTLGPVTIKLGKSYKRLGLFWDNSFYGNIQVYDGLKLDPNYGVSLEGSIGEALAVDFSAQYFIVDGGTNVSLTNRDTLYVPGARRRDALVGRVAPIFRFAEQGSAQLGVSAEHFTADLPAGEEGVTRFAAEAKVVYDGFGAWAEFLLQDGRHVTDFPYAGSLEPPAAGRASGDNKYVLLGAEYGIGPISLRYNVSFADYSDVEVSEIMHVPAIGFAANEHLSLLAEYVLWTRDTHEGGVDVDKSLNVTLSGHF